VNQVPENGKCIYLIDEKGILELIEKYDGDYEIIPVLIKRSPEQLLKSVPPDRLKRDKHRITIEDGFYDHIIENNGTIEEFEDKLKVMINTI
jgi:hypothetical protein